VDAPAPAARSGARRLLGRAVDVRPVERRAVALAFAYFFALLASYYLLRPVRDEMGVRGVGSLQWDFSATFAALSLAVPAYSALVARVPRARAVPLVYRFFLLNLLLFWAAFRFELSPAAAGRVFFVWLSVFNLLVVSVFWSFMADLFSAEQGRRLFGFVAAGGSLGAIVGSATAGLLVGVIGISGLLALSAALLEVAARCAAALARGDTHLPTLGSRPSEPPARGPDAPVGGTALSGVVAVARSPFLRALSAQMLLYTFASTFLYFQGTRIVGAAIPDPARRTAFFAAVDLGVNVAAFATQSLATGRLAVAFGLGPALAAVPLVTLGGLAALATAPTLIVLGGVQALRRVGHYALEKPARDVLYTVVSREEKYKSKGFIETVVYRGGDFLAGWTYTGLAVLGVGASPLAIAALPLGAGSLAVALWLTRRERRLEGT
jgi:ATP:ADP antiporter, AAA family